MVGEYQQKQNNIAWKQIAIKEKKFTKCPVANALHSQSSPHH